MTDLLSSMLTIFLRHLLFCLVDTQLWRNVIWVPISVHLCELGGYTDQLCRLAFMEIRVDVGQSVLATIHGLFFGFFALYALTLLQFVVSSGS